MTDIKPGDRVMTHREAVRRAASWMRNSKGCSVVVSELTTANSETPDVIGWRYGGESVLVECKVSRSDFRADKNKFFRVCEDRGMGDTRYYAAPKGVLQPEDMPDGWGLLEIRPHNVRVLKQADDKQADKKCEVVMLMSAMRRLEISTAVFVRHEAEPTEKREEVEA